LKAMAQRSFTIWLDDRTYIAVDYTVATGYVVAFVVRLMLLIDETEFTVARYDTAHGAPHRDILSRAGNLIRKDWMPHLEVGKVMEYAIDDFKKNYEDYLEKFV
jgi:hypothetical protein